MAHLRDSVLGAAPPLAIFVCLAAGAEPTVLVAVALALMACALIYRLVPGPAPLSTDLPLPALVFGLLPLLQAVPLPAFIWMRLTAVDASLVTETSVLGVILPSTWSLQPEGTLRFGVVAIGAVAVFLLARDAAARPVSRWVLICALIALTGWQSLEGLRQYFAGLWLLKDGEVAHGSFVNRGYYAAFLNSGICLAAGAAYSQASRSTLSPACVTLVVASAFTALVSLAAIVCSQSRSAAIVAGVLLLLGLGMLPLQRRKRAALAMAAVACGGLFLSSSFAAPLLERFQQLHDQGGDIGRLLIWRDSLASLSPLGSGAGSFPWAFRRDAPYFLRKNIDSAHSDYVELAVEFGPWIAALLAASFAVAFVRALVAARRIDASDKPIALSAVFGAAALALHAVTDSILHFPALLFSLAVLLGIAAGLTAPSRGANPRLGTALLAAGLCAATLTLGGAFQPWNLHSQFAAARSNQLDGNAAAAHQGYRAALQANPHSAAPWLGLAELARLQGDDTQALRYVRTARSVEPFTYRVEWALADLELATGDVPGGVETLRMVCDHLPDLRPAAYLLAYRAGAPLTLIENRLTAPEPYAVGEYLAFLIRSGNQDQVADAQHRLVEMQGVTLSEAHRRFISNAF